jgi:anti-anti-sigma regulatory factor
MTIAVRIAGPSSTAVSINSQNQQKVRSLTPTVVATTTLVELNDVSVIDSSNNSTLVYNSSTLKYEIKALPIVFGGTF